MKGCKLDFQQRLHNWAMWAKARRSPPISCKSLEHNYKAPPMWEVPSLKSEPDINDAIIVEAHIVALAKKHMMIIVYSRINPTYSYNGFMRKAKIKDKDFQETLKQAELALENSLNQLLTH